MTHAIDYTTRAVFWRCGDNGGRCFFWFASVGFFRLAAWTLMLCRMLGYCALPKVPSAFDKVVTGLLLPLVSRLQSFWLCPRYLPCAALHQHAKMLNRSCYVSLNLDFFGTLLFIGVRGNPVRIEFDQVVLWPKATSSILRLQDQCRPQGVFAYLRGAQVGKHIRGVFGAQVGKHTLKCVCLLARKINLCFLVFSLNWNNLFLVSKEE